MPLNINGDCVTASCPPNAPHPVGCNITFDGGDDRGCVAHVPGSSAVYFQEGDACLQGHLSGTLLDIHVLDAAAAASQRCLVRL